MGRGWRRHEWSQPVDMKRQTNTINGTLRVWRSIKAFIVTPKRCIFAAFVSHSKTGEIVGVDRAEVFLRRARADSVAGEEYVAASEREPLRFPSCRQYIKNTARPLGGLL